MNHATARERAQQLWDMRARHEQEEQDFFGALEAEAAQTYGAEDGWALVALISYLVDARQVKHQADHSMNQAADQLKDFFDNGDDGPEPEQPIEPQGGEHRPALEDA